MANNEQGALANTKSVTTVKTTTTTTTKTKQQHHQDVKPSVAVVEELGRTADFRNPSESATAATATTTSQQANESIQERGDGKQQEGSKLTTTIGTIAAQSSQSRIVVALLRNGLQLELKIQEMRPGVFEVGTERSECAKYVEEHERLMRNLQKHRRAPIEAWATKYQRVTEQQPDMGADWRLVYACMAENLQACWRTLWAQLEERRRLLASTGTFYESAERLVETLVLGDQRVQQLKREFLAGADPNRLNQLASELHRVNQLALEQYTVARDNQQSLLETIAKLAATNLGDSRPNHLVGDAQNLINYIRAYLEPLEKRRIELESVIKTTLTNVNTTTTRTRNDTQQRRQQQQQQQQNFKEMRERPKEATTTTSMTTTTTRQTIREISNFNDLNLVDNWLNVKIEQLNSNPLSSLGASASDSRALLAKHEQIALECSAIEEATLQFNGKNIHAIRSADNEPLFEQQKALATRARDVITILDARIVLLRRTIDFYLRSKDATLDIGRMMRRLQVDNSLQSVQYVANELELKDVSSVVASGATIVSELQQLQLAQKHGQRSRLVNLNLLTDGVRAIIDQLSQDLAHLKNVLKQRRLVLLNEDAAKKVANFSNKCHQLQFWLNNHVRSPLESDRHIEPANLVQVQAYCQRHDQLRNAIQAKTLEVEALLRLHSTLADSLDANSQTAELMQNESDALRRDWITVTNCLDRRLDLARKYLNLLQTSPPNNDNNMEPYKNQINTFINEANQIDSKLPPAPNQSGSSALASDVNKHQLVDHAKTLLSRPAPTAATSSTSGPKFVKGLSEVIEVEPFSSVTLECELEPSDCLVEWLMNNFNRIPASIKHTITSPSPGRHRLTIDHFSPQCCGLYTVRATTTSLGAPKSITSQCRLRLSGIKEQYNDKNNNNNNNDEVLASPASSFSHWRPSSKSASGMERIIRGVTDWRDSESPSANNLNRQRVVSTSASTTTETIENRKTSLPLVQSSYKVNSSQQQQQNSVHLRPPSNTGSTTSGRSDSKSPFAGTPQAPAFVQSLSECSGSSCGGGRGRAGGLVCVVVGNPAPTIEWSHNNHVIATAKCRRTPTGTTKERLCKLTIETASEPTSGQYVCRASNRLGESSTAITLSK